MSITRITNSQEAKIEIHTNRQEVESELTKVIQKYLNDRISKDYPIDDKSLTDFLKTVDVKPYEPDVQVSANPAIEGQIIVSFNVPLYSYDERNIIEANIPYVISKDGK